MSLFHILQQSPYDANPSPCNQKQETAFPLRWLPSRFNARASTTDGSLVVWNVYSNRMSLFKPRLVPRVLETLSQRGIEGKPEGLIKFLADRGFLVPAEINELRRFRHVFNQDHYAKDRLHLFLLSSEDCNFRCKYCYEKFERGTMEPWVRSAVKQYLAKQMPGLKRFKLEWFGGEPLYGMEAIAEIAPVALELAQKHSIEYTSRMATNGYLLTPDIVDKLFAWGILIYQITLDGPPEHHDRCRPGRDGSPTFGTILENLKAMQRRSETFQVLLRINFDRDNSPGLTPLLDILERELEGDSRFRFAFRTIARWGGEADDQLNICTPEESSRLYERMEAEVKKRGLILDGSIYNAGGIGAHVCYAARPTSFIIGATGKVMKCTIELDTNDRNVVGNINEAGDLTLDDNKMSLWTEPAFESDHKCQKCIMMPSCAGMSCPLIRFQTDDSPCVAERTTFKKELRKAAAEFQAHAERGAAQGDGQTETLATETEQERHVQLQR
jgi:uncharacterized protein